MKRAGADAPALQSVKKVSFLGDFSPPLPPAPRGGGRKWRPCGPPPLFPPPYGGGINKRQIVKVRFFDKLYHINSIYMMTAPLPPSAQSDETL